jgi:hypothetical protein
MPGRHSRDALQFISEMRIRGSNEPPDMFEVPSNLRFDDCFAGRAPMGDITP